MRYVFDKSPYPAEGKDGPDPANDFEAVDCCPICSSTNIKPLFAVKGSDGSIGNRGAFCFDCEHTFKSRRPSVAWYEEYYRDDWDGGTVLRPRRSFRQTARSAVRSVVMPSRLISFYDKESQSGHVKGMRILPMLTGIATGDSYGLRPDPKVKSVLEIGAGYGSALNLFNELGLRAVGLETSRARAASCKADGLDVTACAIEDAATTIKGGPFDLLYSAHVFEHILHPTAALQSCAQLVRDGGFIYIEVPSVNECEGLMKFAHEVAHVQAFSMTSLVRMLELAGFRTIRMRTGVTLHIVGVKEAGGRGGPRGFADVDTLTRGAGAIGYSGRATVSFSHRDFVVKDSSGNVVHSDNMHFYREDTRFVDVTATLEPGEGEIEFCAPGPATVWVKRQ